MSTAAETKTLLRRQLRAALAALTSAEREAASDQVVQRIGADPRWRAARTVMLFIPLADELNILPLVDRALRHHKTVLLPRFDPVAGNYQAARVSNLANDLVRGPFGVTEPRADCPAIPVKQLDVTLVPGLGFDRVGRRLGRGKGHYDRLLADAAGSFWGVGHDCQLVPEVPGEPHDVALNCIVTPVHWVEVVPVRR